MTIQDLQDELRSQVRARIGRGELTGSGLARDACFPQGHLSNFLNSRRGLSVESMDRLLDAMGIGVLDLVSSEEVQRRVRPRHNSARFELVALVAEEDASRARFQEDQILDTRSFRTAFLRRLKVRVAVDRRDWLRFVLVKLDGRSSEGLFPAGVSTTLLIDRHYSSLQPYRQHRPNLYAVRVAGRCVVAYLSMCDNCMVLRRRSPEHEVEIIRLRRGEEYSDYIVGRVCHVGIEV
jgi:hypothetical protein